jgi:hypothetical protein
MPWPWQAAVNCLNLANGQILHFPAGSYNQQVATPLGKMQLDMMQLAYQAFVSFNKKFDAVKNPHTEFDISLIKIVRELG